MALDKLPLLKDSKSARRNVKLATKSVRIVGNKAAAHLTFKPASLTL